MNNEIQKLAAEVKRLRALKEELRASWKRSDEELKALAERRKVAMLAYHKAENDYIVADEKFMHAVRVEAGIDER